MPQMPSDLQSGSDCRAAIYHDRLARDVASGISRQKYRGTGNVVRLADAAHGILRLGSGKLPGILPERSREVCSHEPWRDRVDADVVLPPRDGEVARHGHDRSLGNAVGADVVGALDTGNRRNEDNRAVPSLGHLGQNKAGKPQIGPHIAVDDLLECRFTDRCHRTVVGIDGCVAHEAVDPAESLHGLLDEMVELVDMGDIAGHRCGFTACRPDLADDLFTGIDLAAGYHDHRAGFGHSQGDGAAYSPGTTGDNSHLPRQIEQPHGYLP